MQKEKAIQFHSLYVSFSDRIKVYNSYHYTVACPGTPRRACSQASNHEVTLKAPILLPGTLVFFSSPLTSGGVEKALDNRHPASPCLSEVFLACNGTASVSTAGRQMFSRKLKPWAALIETGNRAWKVSDTQCRNQVIKAPFMLLLLY